MLPQVVTNRLWERESVGGGGSGVRDGEGSGVRDGEGSGLRDGGGSGVWEEREVE